jgi:DNA primase
VEQSVTENQPNRTDKPRYRGISYTRPIDAAKEAVPVIDLADRLCGAGGLRKVGANWTGRCPLPDHEDKVPSFVVYPETNSFFCFGCLRGGDVVELYRLAEGYDEREVRTAAGMLLMEFGHTPPERPPAWHRKQERQRPTRDAVEQTKKNIVRRRLFRHLILPLIDAIEDEGERSRELERAWSEFERLTA